MKNRTVFLKAYPGHIPVQTVLMLLFPFGSIAMDLLGLFPDFTEEIYASALRPRIMQPISRFFALFDFSVAEVLTVLCAFAAVASVFYAVFRAVRDRTKIIDYITRFAAILSCAVFIFQCLYGGCYYRKSISEKLELPSFSHSVQDLVSLAEYLIDEMNTLRTDAGVGENEKYDFSVSVAEISEICADAYEIAGRKNGVFSGNYGKAKGVFLSKAWTYTFVMGMYFPYTGEANINTNIPQIELPQTVLHEMAHQRGIAREEDADFAAFYVSRMSRNGIIRYSCDFEVLKDVLYSVYSSDLNEYYALLPKIGDGIRNELIEYEKFWADYSTKAATASNSINNAYLNANGQSAGVASYGYSLQLIMDYYTVTEFEKNGE